MIQPGPRYSKEGWLILVPRHRIDPIVQGFATRKPVQIRRNLFEHRVAGQRVIRGNMRGQPNLWMGP